jgi:hypothetical protein
MVLCKHYAESVAENATTSPESSYWQGRKEGACRIQHLIHEALEKEK